MNNSPMQQQRQVALTAVQSSSMDTVDCSTERTESHKSILQRLGESWFITFGMLCVITFAVKFLSKCL